MRMRVPFLSLVFALAVTPALANIHISVDKTAQTLTVTRDGQVLHTWPVSTGRTGRFTPSGKFRAFRLEKDHFSREFDDAPMPHSIFFTDRGHAIHGSFDTKKLGRPASGGCVRLAPEHAKTLFEMVQANGVLKTTVAIQGDERVAIARANRELTEPRQASRERATGMPPQYIPQDEEVRDRTAVRGQAGRNARPQETQGFYFDGYQWRPYQGSAQYRANPQPHYEPRHYYPPQPYYQPRYGYRYY
jgi:hypothetical protein